MSDEVAPASLGGCPTRPRPAARRPRPGAARGGARDERPGRDPRRRRDRQDPRHQPADGVRDRDRRRAAGPGARRHVHRQGRGRDGRAAAGARPAGRHGADVPRPRAQPAAPLLAVAPRRRAAPRAARLEDPDPRPARAPAARPLPVHAGQGPRRRDRVGEVAPDRAAGVRARGRRASRPGASRRSRSTCSSGPSTTTSGRRRGPGRIDFDDLLVETVGLLEDDAEAADTVRARKRWFSVDEYQDTSPLQQRLLELWLGDRPDLCVVGDVDQTIYTFTGATSGYLTGVRRAAPGRAGPRPDPELPLDAAGPRARQPADRRRRAVEAAGGEPRATGPEPTITRTPSADAELDAHGRRDPRPDRATASRPPRSRSSSG